MPPIEISAARHALSARAAIDAFHSAVQRGAGITPIEVTVLLTNLVAIGEVVPKVLAQLSANLSVPVQPGDPTVADDPATTDRAFTIQIAQHYLELTAAAVSEAAEMLGSAVNAISSLDPNR